MLPTFSTGFFHYKFKDFITHNALHKDYGKIFNSTKTFFYKFYSNP